MLVLFVQVMIWRRSGVVSVIVFVISMCRKPLPDRRPTNENQRKHYGPEASASLKYYLKLQNGVDFFSDKLLVRDGGSGGDEAFSFQLFLLLYFLVVFFLLAGGPQGRFHTVACS